MHSCPSSHSSYRKLYFEQPPTQPGDTSIAAQPVAFGNPPARIIQASRSMSKFAAEGIWRGLRNDCVGESAHRPQDGTASPKIRPSLGGARVRQERDNNTRRNR